MMDLIKKDFEVSEAMANIATKALRRVCRLADKYGVDRNMLINRFIVGLSDTTSKCDFSQLPPRTTKKTQ